MTRVLVVDDEPDVLSSLIDLFNQMPEDFDVHGAPDGRAALQALQDKDFDVVVTDYRMPGMNGLELLHAARGRYPKGAILVTAFDHQAEATLAARRGLIRRFVRKPGDPALLQQMLRELLFPEHLFSGDAPGRPGPTA